MKKDRFVKEDRYIVIKKSDSQMYLSNEEQKLLAELNEKVQEARKRGGKDHLSVVVVESDWPEYEGVWDAISRRIGGNTN